MIIGYFAFGENEYPISNSECPTDEILENSVLNIGY